MKIATICQFLLSWSVLLNSAYVYAQTENISQSSASDPHYKSLFDENSQIRISGFFGVLNSLTPIDNHVGHFLGVGGGISLNDVFVGGYVEGLTNAIDTRGSIAGRYVQLDHGGIWLGYTAFANSLVHPVIHVKTGWGSLKAADNLGFQTSSDQAESSPIFLASPALDVEFNLTKFARLSVGVSYRWARRVDLGEYENKNFNAPGAHLLLKLGRFSR